MGLKTTKADIKLLNLDECVICKTEEKKAVSANVRRPGLEAWGSAARTEPFFLKGLVIENVCGPRPVTCHATSRFPSISILKNKITVT